VSTDARPEAPSQPVQSAVHGELPSAARALAAPSTVAVLAPGAGPAGFVFAGGRVPTTRPTESAPPTPAPSTPFASRGRCGRGQPQGVHFGVRAAI